MGLGWSQGRDEWSPRELQVRTGTGGWPWPHEQMMKHAGDREDNETEHAVTIVVGLPRQSMLASLARGRSMDSYLNITTEECSGIINLCV